MIKLILLDVDGTLTDGGIYLGNSGEELKKFNVKDGYAIWNYYRCRIRTIKKACRKIKHKILVSRYFRKNCYFR